MSGVEWREDDGIGALIGPDGSVLAHYDHSGRKNHPYFRDVRPLGHAGVMTGHAPWDHRWHHGLWWSWKFIDDVLYWEDHEGFGGNRIGLGRAHVTAHRVDRLKDVVVVAEELEWRDDATRSVAMTERREMTFGTDMSTGLWRIDWDMTWTAVRDVTLDVTPFADTPWGGYGGLNLRASRSMVADEQIMADGGRAGAHEIHGEDVEWVSYSGNLDGSEVDDPDHPAHGGVLLVAHPDNTEGRSAYVFSAVTDFGFAAMAPLMHGPRRLVEGETLRLRYRSAIYGERPTAERLGAAADDYRRR